MNFGNAERLSFNESASRSTTRNRGARLALRILVVAVVVYVGMIIMLLWMETAMVYPAPRYPIGQWTPRNIDFDEVRFTSQDGTALVGWHLRHPNPEHYFLHCHGNGENVAMTGPLLEFYRQRFNATVFGFDYRGYGKSEGTPNQQGLYEDGLAALQAFCELEQIDPDQVIVIGRSLGAAVAVHVAVEGGARALILENAFSSMVDVAASIYPFFPVRWLMRNQYPTADLIAEFHGPLLQSHGARDSIVPVQFGRTLFEASPSQHKHWIEFADRDHNDPPPEEYWDTFESFLNSLQQSAQ